MRVPFYKKNGIDITEHLFQGVFHRLKHFWKVSLFNAEAIFVEEQQWYYLTKFI